MRSGAALSWPRAPPCSARLPGRWPSQPRAASRRPRPRSRRARPWGAGAPARQSTATSGTRGRSARATRPRPRAPRAARAAARAPPRSRRGAAPPPGCRRLHGRLCRVEPRAGSRLLCRPARAWRSTWDKLLELVLDMTCMQAHTAGCPMRARTDGPAAVQQQRRRGRPLARREQRGRLRGRRARAQAAAAVPRQVRCVEVGQAAAAQDGGRAGLCDRPHLRRGLRADARPAGTGGAERSRSGSEQPAQARPPRGGADGARQPA